MIRSIIIDDEPSAIEVIKLMLKKKCSQDVEVIASSTSPFEAIGLIEKLEPDLVFLDIEMPGMTGMEVATHFKNPAFNIIFITAYDAFALEAFKVNAIDYILKPVDSQELIKAIEKVKQLRNSREGIGHSQFNAIHQMLSKTSIIREKRIGIGMADKIQFIDVENISYCQANGAYTNVYLLDGSRLVASKGLGDFEEMLMPFSFFRIHNSYLINLNWVKEFQRSDGGYVVMNDNVKLEVSQRKRKDFLDAVDHLIV